MSDFLSQGGYAAYVWGSYGMGLALIVLEIVWLRRERAVNRARVRRWARLQRQGGGQ